ncbi:hypothetical protein VTK73DRAFT_4836 [Phialemonium thermophilum]|uniref:Uncharacterized protein n=1 Tax=Phialemonium thermophilum TaxID=223376 RepID=A0ABR3WS06_9PEZI
MRAREQHHKSALDLVIQRAESVREQLREKVRGITSQNKEKFHVAQRIKFLSRERDAKDFQIKEEKQRNESIGTTSQPEEVEEAVDSLQGRLVDLLGRLHDQEIGRAQEEKDRENTNQAILDTVLANLESLATIVRPQAQAITRLIMTTKKTARRCFQKWKLYYVSKSEVVEAFERVAADLKCHMTELQQELDRQEATSTQRLSENQLENSFIIPLPEDREEDLQVLGTQPEEAKQVAAAQPICERRATSLGFDSTPSRAGVDRAVAFAPCKLATGSERARRGVDSFVQTMKQDDFHMGDTLRDANTERNDDTAKNSHRSTPVGRLNKNQGITESRVHNRLGDTSNVKYALEVSELVTL